MASWPQFVAWCHLATAMVIVGGQLVITVLVFARSPSGGEDQVQLFWWSLERRYRRFAAVMLVAGVGMGFLLLRHTLISPTLLLSTPYGPILAAKGILAILFLLYLVVAPTAHTAPAGGSTRAARVWAVLASLLALGLVALSQALRYA